MFVSQRVSISSLSVSLPLPLLVLEQSSAFNASFMNIYNKLDQDTMKLQQEAQTVRRSLSLKILLALKVAQGHSQYSTGVAYM